METLTRNGLTYLVPSVRNQFIDLPYESIDWFLYDNTIGFTKFETKSVYPIGTKTFLLSLSFRNTSAVV